MGHYYSEMYSDEYFEEQDRKKKERYQKVKDKITKDLEKGSLEDVLTQIVLDPSIYRNA